MMARALNHQDLHTRQPINQQTNKPNQPTRPTNQPTKQISNNQLYRNIWGLLANFIDTAYKINAMKRKRDRVKQISKHILNQTNTTHTYQLNDTRTIRLHWNSISAAPFARARTPNWKHLISILLLYFFWKIERCEADAAYSNREEKNTYFKRKGETFFSTDHCASWSEHTSKSEHGHVERIRRIFEWK